MRNVIVLMCNNNEYYIKEMLRTIYEIRKIGNYNLDIVLMIGNDLKEKLAEENEITIKLRELSVIIKYFEDIDRSKYLKLFEEKPFQEGDKREITKVFQYHKFHLFNIYFKQWDKIFYIDVGMHIFKDLNRMLNIECNNKILAHADAYPYYKNKLECQFEKITYKEVYDKLKQKYNMKKDHFQTGILMFNTNIIKENTFNELVKLSDEYYNSKTNEQGILNLYFIDNWSQIKLKDDETYYYDMWERGKLRKKDYIMLKRIRFG